MSWRIQDEMKPYAFASVEERKKKTQGKNNPVTV